MLKRLLPLVTLLFAGALMLAACGDGGSSTDSSSASTGGTTASTAACEAVPEAEPKTVKLDPPSADAPTAKTVVFDTSCGSFTVMLDAERAPKTAASFQYLAEKGVYDGTGFHRVAPGFVIQGGDPAGDGTGGPGYTIDEKPPGGLSYTQGVVAMAKTSAEPPGRSGSQFFVVTAPDAGLPPDYAVAGTVTDGFETVQAIEALGQPGSDGPPSQPVIINSATPQS